LFCILICRHDGLRGTPPSPRWGGAVCLTQAPGPQLVAVGDTCAQECNNMGFAISYKYTHTHIYIYISKTYITIDSEGQNIKENRKATGWATRSHWRGGSPKLSPTDRRRRPTPLVDVSRQDQPPARPPEPTSGIGGCPVRAACPNRPGRRKSPRPAMIVVWPQQHARR
jgi:hypothetical protein